jgi:thioredoxin reductase
MSAGRRSRLWPKKRCRRHGDRLELVSSPKTGGKGRKSGKAEAKLIVLNPGFQASTEGLYAIGAAISPFYAVIGKDGALERKKHTDLIFTAVKDGVMAVEEIARRKI